MAVTATGEAGPRRADLKVGFACNSHCRHCVVGDRRGTGPKTTEQIFGELDQARQAGCEEVVLTGGEPTIRRDIIQIASRARELGFKPIQIQTNGRMLSSRELCEDLVNAGVEDFVVAVHGDRREVHEYLTESPGGFVQTLRGIRNLKLMGRRVAVNVVVSRPNYRRLPRISQLLTRLGVDQFQFAFVHPLGRARENFPSVVPRLVLVEPFVKAGLDVGRRKGIRVMTEAIPACFMRGYEDLIAERMIPPTTIYDVGHQVEDYGWTRRHEGKAKGPPCARCMHDSWCEGPWREYPEYYGWAEFQPVVEAGYGTH